MRGDTRVSIFLLCFFLPVSSEIRYVSVGLKRRHSMQWKRQIVPGEGKSKAFFYRCSTVFHVLSLKVSLEPICVGNLFLQDLPGFSQSHLTSQERSYPCNRGRFHMSSTSCTLAAETVTNFHFKSRRWVKRKTLCSNKADWFWLSNAWAPGNVPLSHFFRNKWVRYLKVVVGRFLFDYLWSIQ